MCKINDAVKGVHMPTLEWFVGGDSMTFPLTRSEVRSVLGNPEVGDLRIC